MYANTEVFAEVPAGLAHDEPLVTTMKASADDYAQVSSLPDFNLFTVFFRLPGALIALLAVFGLVAGREREATATAVAPRPTPTPTH